MLLSSESYQQRLAALLPAFLLLCLVTLSGTEPLMLGKLSISLFVSWAGVYYWALFRPTTLPYVFIFFIGLIQDTVMGLPIGLNPFILIIMRFAITRLKHFVTIDHFWAIWSGFLITSISFSCLAFAIVSVIEASWLTSQLGEWMLNSFATWAIYPLIHLIFNRTYRLLPRLHSRSQNV